MAQSPTPFDDDSDDSGAPTVIADSDTGQLDSELDVGIEPFTAVGTVGSRQGDVAEASGSAVAAPAATSFSAMLDRIDANHHWHRVLHQFMVTVMTHLLQQS